MRAPQRIARMPETSVIVAIAFLLDEVTYSGWFADAS